MANDQTTQAVESLAAEIGENIYIDVAKWHLYLSDAHLHTVVAEKIYPLLEDEAVTEEAIIDILRGIPVSLGGGRKEVSLLDLLPKQCQMKFLE